MSHALATFIVSALLTLGISAFVLALALGLWQHFRWKHRIRRRIGWYT
jgi:hypothetical protein